MQTLTFQEIENKYWAAIELFCFKVLGDKLEAVVNAANVFTTFQTKIAKEEFDKWQDEDKIRRYLFLLARTRCIQRLRWIRLHQKRESKNIFVIFFNWLLNYE